MLKLQDVVKNYTQSGQTIEVLKGISFEIAEGETLAVQGPSGSGKSTLLSLISGLDRPTRGEVFIAGRSTRQMNEAELTDLRAKTIGFIFQQFHLLPNLTALENVQLPLEILGQSSSADLARKTLEDVGLGHRMKHFPHQLSGGECQRVAIARSLIHKPPLILADEPSGNLDSKTGEQVMNLLFEIVERSKMTLILVTHSTELAAKCHVRKQIRDGKLIS